MSESAELHFAHLTTNRNCTVEIKNDSTVYCLNNPKVYLESGFCHSPPQPTVRSGKTEVCSFTKDDNTASGAAGLLTYELFSMRDRGCHEMMVVMFSVPFDYNLFKNWMGVGVLQNFLPVDQKLFKHMYNDKEDYFHRHESDGSVVKFSSNTVDVMACMSSEGRAIIKLELYDKMY